MSSKVFHFWVFIIEDFVILSILLINVLFVLVGDSDTEKGENALKDTEDETETDTECGTYLIISCHWLLGNK